MAQRRFRTNVVVSYEPDEAGWIKPTVPAMPSVVSAGTSREDAREMVIDALMQLLAVEREREVDGDYETRASRRLDRRRRTARSATGEGEAVSAPGHRIWTSGTGVEARLSERVGDPLPVVRTCVRT